MKCREKQTFSKAKRPQPPSSSTGNTDDLNKNNDMDIVITSIERESIQAYTDNQLLYVAPGDTYHLSFVIVKNGRIIESNTTIRHDTPLSFEKAEMIIRDTMSDA